MATEATVATAAKALSEAKVVADAQAKTKGYLGRIKAAVGDAANNQCIEESHLDQEVVGHGKRTVGKVRAVFAGGRGKGSSVSVRLFRVAQTATCAKHVLSAGLNSHGFMIGGRVCGGHTLSYVGLQAHLLFGVRYWVRGETG